MNRRGPFDGVKDVFRFNWPTFAAAATAAGALSLARSPVARLAGLGLFTGIAGSLSAVHVAYDRSRLYDLDWLPSFTAPTRVLVLHAGLDEISETISALPSVTHVDTTDFLGDRKDSEPSIIRARQSQRGIDAPSPERVAALGATYDLIVGFLSLHELRTSDERVALLRDASGALAPNGRVLIVEHMRDLANVTAFGWGATHFFTRSQWLADLDAAGLRVERRDGLSPFITHLWATRR